MAALAAAMMLGNGDGLSMLQTLSIVAAFPFAFIMVISMAALVRALRKESEE
jgi:glycine betaine transporter